MKKRREMNIKNESKNEAKMKNSEGGCFSSSSRFSIVFDLISPLFFEKIEIEK